MDTTRTETAPPPVADSGDPDAPFGRNTDGTPLAPFGYTSTGAVRKSKGGRPLGKRSAGRPGGSGRRRTTNGPTPSAPPKKPTTNKPGTGPARPPAELVVGITGIWHMGGAMLAARGLEMDGCAVMMSAPAVGAAAADIVMLHPQWRTAVERMMTYTPYGALVAALAQPLAQILANHQLIPPQIGKMLGAQPPAQFREQVLSWSQEAAAAQAAEAAEWGAAPAPAPTSSTPPPTTPAGPADEPRTYLHSVTDTAGDAPAWTDDATL